jgi:hypothetical protein
VTVEGRIMSMLTKEQLFAAPKLVVLAKARIALDRGIVVTWPTLSN